MKAGPLNLITDVPGLCIGNAEDHDILSGTTVILPDSPAIAAVDVRGGGPGTRETDLLSPDATVDRIDAICLSGGSAFGLDAASGVQSWLVAQGRGFQIGHMRVPIVPAAILFDLLNGGDKNWMENPPYRNLGLQACNTKTRKFTLGNAGAGLGAQAGKLKGGLGSTSIIDSNNGWTIGALAVVNSVGAVTMNGRTRDEGGCFWAWPFELEGELGNQTPPISKPSPIPCFHMKENLRANTTIATIATNAPLTQSQLRRVAIMAQDGLARAIHPVHSPLDGDVVFALSTAPASASFNLDHSAVAHIGALAADCLARAIARGVYEAKSLGGIPSYQ